MTDAAIPANAGERATDTPMSVIDQIRKRHEARSRHLDLPIPEWDGDVVVRFGRLSKKSITAAGRRRGNAARINADLLVAACREILVRDADGELVPAREADGQPSPIRFDGRLADLFGLVADTQTDIVLRMYGDEIAVAAHAKKVYDWQTGADLNDLDAEEVEDLAGEVEAAT